MADFRAVSIFIKKMQVLYIIMKIQHKIFLKKLYATPIYHGINTRLCEHDKF